MAAVVEPTVDEPVPPTGDAGHGRGGDPWWHSPWRLVVMAVALVFLGGAIGYALTARADAPPGAGSVDVGFLQDMRYHHDQAVRMSLDLLNKPAAGQDPNLRAMAAEILLSQQLEAGAMAQLLNGWGQPEANESGTGMAWMSMPVPVDRMPGMATEAELDLLAAATGVEADRLFVTLMTAHHEGGIAMAEHAIDHADAARVRELAAKIVDAQRDEIGELRRVEATLGTSTS